MALLDPYCSVAELRNYAGIDDQVDDTLLSTVVRGVSRQGINVYCGRQFNDAGSATARTFQSESETCVKVDDFSTATGLIVKIDSNDDGLYSTTLGAVYNLYPIDGIVNGEPGYPFERIELFWQTTPYFPRLTKRNNVQVTARWGWAAVPDAVKQACLIKSARVFRRRYALDGLIGQGDFVFRISSREDPDVVGMLAGLRRTSGVIV